MTLEQKNQLIRFLQNTMPICSHPFQELADTLNISEQEIVATIKEWQKQGRIRRLGVLMNHQKAGFRANALSVWSVPEEEIAKAGNEIISHPEVGHCYQRNMLPDWPYNLYAMIHAQTHKAVEEIAADISRDIGIDQYQLLFTKREFKKTSMQYDVNEIPKESEE